MWPFTTKSRPSKEETDLGNVLLKMGVIDEDLLKKALAEQSRVEEKSLLGSILVRMGVLDEALLDRALKLQKKLRTGNKGDAMIEIVSTRTDRMCEKHSFERAMSPAPALKRAAG